MPLYIIAVERYQELLKWKEEKKKKLMMEKKRRKPAFKTGIYHPQQPKFLTSGDSVSEYSTSYIES